MASQSCSGALEFVDGGVINATTVTNSQIVTSVIQNSAFEAGRITNLVSIDDASASLIAKAFLSLGEDDLKRLATAILGAAELPTAPQPSLNEGNLSRQHYGSADAVLGKPDKWLTVGGGAVPLYN